MTPVRYASSAIALHWAIALLLAFQMGLGWHMMNMPQGAAMFSAFQFHKSIGLLILTLSLARIGVRIALPRPAVVETGRAKRMLAKIVHSVFYIVMIVGPLTGWMVVSTAKIAVPTMFFGTIPVPHLPIDQALHDVAEQGHSWLAWIGAALILLHVAGAIRHHLPLGVSEEEAKEDVIGRMIPVNLRKSESNWKIALAGGAAAVLFAGFAAPWLIFVTARSQAAPVQAIDAQARESSISPIASPPAAEASIAADAAGSEATPADKEPSNWTVDGGGMLGFTATMNGAAINGRFERWSAEVQFDPEALEASRIVVRIPLLSANSGDASRDEMLKGPNFFGNAGANAVFRSEKIRLVAGSRYSAGGTLTMNGKSRPLTLNFNLTISGAKARVSGSSQLDRVAFGIGAGEWASTDQIAGEVRVNFAFSARRAN